MGKHGQQWTSLEECWAHNPKVCLSIESCSASVRPPMAQNALATMRDHGSWPPSLILSRVWRSGVMVITEDSESSNPGSIPGFALFSECIVPPPIGYFSELSVEFLNQMISHLRRCGLANTASVYGTGDSGFESQLDHLVVYHLPVNARRRAPCSQLEFKLRMEHSGFNRRRRKTRPASRF